VCPYKYENPLENIMLNGTQMCKTDIVYRLLCTLADTDHHGLREETNCQCRKVKNIYVYLQFEFRKKFIFGWTKYWTEGMANLTENETSLRILTVSEWLPNISCGSVLEWRIRNQQSWISNPLYTENLIIRFWFSGSRRETL